MILWKWYLPRSSLHILKKLFVGLVLLPQAQYLPEENAENIDTLEERS